MLENKKTNMATLAAVLIVKNEEENIENCLKSLDFADEIIILDSNSGDKTVKIAQKYTDKIYVDNNWSGYGIQRQKAQKHVNCDWVLMIDADEIVTEKLKKNILKVIRQDNKNCVYSLSRLSICFGRKILHSGWYPDWITRLYPNNSANWDDALVHEKLLHNLKNVKLKGDLIHYPYKNLSHYLIKSSKYAQAWARSKNKLGKKASLTQGIIHAIACFIKMYIIKLGFLDKKQGFLLAILSAHSTFIKYADLWELQNNEK